MLKKESNLVEKKSDQSRSNIYIYIQIVIHKGRMDNHLHGFKT